MNSNNNGKGKFSMFASLIETTSPLHQDTNNVQFITFYRKMILNILKSKNELKNKILTIKVLQNTK